MCQLLDPVEAHPHPIPSAPRSPDRPVSGFHTFTTQVGTRNAAKHCFVYLNVISGLFLQPAYSLTDDKHRGVHLLRGLQCELQPLHPSA